MDILSRLRKSKFRSSFKLNAEDIDYIKKKGMSKIREDTKEILRKRIKKKPQNDSRQTPYKGHPVFKAQHGTATCCRKCISKWYKINSERELSENELTLFTDLITAWIAEELRKNSATKGF